MDMYHVICTYAKTKQLNHKCAKNYLSTHPAFILTVCCKTHKIDAEDAKLHNCVVHSKVLSMVLAQNQCVPTIGACDLREQQMIRKPQNQCCMTQWEETLDSHLCETPPEQLLNSQCFLRESYWIFELRTLMPEGLNVDDSTMPCLDAAVASVR